MQSLPPVGDIGGDLGSISCRPSACTAAGYVNGQSDEGPGTAPLAMRWNATGGRSSPPLATPPRMTPAG